MDEQKPVLKYITISIAPSTHGQNLAINPRRPDTDSAVEAAKKESLAGALNKLAEYGYRLLDGTVLPLCLDAAARAPYSCTVSVEPLRG